MICPNCGQPKPPAKGSVTALRAELRRKELVTLQLYLACKAGRYLILSNAKLAKLGRPTLTEMELAIKQAREESVA